MPETLESNLSWCGSAWREFVWREWFWREWFWREFVWREFAWREFVWRELRRGRLGSAARPCAHLRGCVEL
eukprot:6195867-Pleurochrysis_carterae.AAC.1